MTVLLVVAATVAAAVVAASAAAPERTMPIRIGVGLGSINLGMSGQPRLPGVRDRHCRNPNVWLHWYLRRGNTELVFHPGTGLRATAVDVRSAPVLGCATP